MERHVAEARDAVRSEDTAEGSTSKFNALTSMSGVAKAPHRFAKFRSVAHHALSCLLVSTDDSIPIIR
jgi:hypothetical protein